MIKILCDRCSAEIKGCNIGYIAINWRDMPNGDLLYDNPHEDKHFCGSCMKEIEEFITKKQAESVPICQEQPSEQEQPKETPPRKRIDYGKLMALRNAGWPNAKIADEMGMSKGAVSVAISTYKKKHSGGVICGVDGKIGLSAGSRHLKERKKVRWQY